MALQIPWGTALVFVGTLPILGTMVWNLIEFKGIRAEVTEIRKELSLIRERRATLEERDRWMHPVVHS